MVNPRGPRFKPIAERSLCLAVIVTVMTLAATAQGNEGGVVLIRDAETESALHLILDPLVQAAGLADTHVLPRLYNATSPNVFSFESRSILISSGLLCQLESPGELIGVGAHVIGHLARGHQPTLVNHLGKNEVAAIQIVSSVVSLIGANDQLRRGDLEGFQAFNSLEGPWTAPEAIFRYSESQEAAADQLALEILEKTHQSPVGLVHLMERFDGQEFNAGHKAAFAQMHRIDAERVERVRAMASRSPWSAEPVNPAFSEPFERIRAKACVLSETPQRTSARYKKTDTNTLSVYARAVAALRKPDFPGALVLADSLIERQPRDPFFHELKAQILWQSQRGAESIAEYKKAQDLLPDNALLELETAQAEINQDSPAVLLDAQARLIHAAGIDNKDSLIWHQLGTVFEKTGNEGLAAFVLAREAALDGDTAKSVYFADQADRLIPQHDATRSRLQAIVASDP
jgi:predicted Zn-dependent protease